MAFAVLQRKTKEETVSSQPAGVEFLTLTSDVEATEGDCIAFVRPGYPLESFLYAYGSPVKL